MPSRQPRSTIDVPLGQNAASAFQSTPSEAPHLTAPDQYFLAYQHYLNTHNNTEPKGAAAFEELSQHLADLGIRGAKGRPVSPSTLRRYALEQRIYKRWPSNTQNWASHHPLRLSSKRLAQDGIRAAKPPPHPSTTLSRAQQLASGFRRRHTTLRHHQEDNTRP